MYWYCLTHDGVEPDEGCAGKNRLGPYDTEAEALRALETVEARNDEWDNDPAWNDEDDWDAEEAWPTRDDA